MRDGRACVCASCITPATSTRRLIISHLPPSLSSPLSSPCSARAFLGIVERFKERLAWHGQSAESNPSGGNNYRGLYNIGLKSLGEWEA